jgi:glycosyltransferase involved in cell wall biosynthesis
VNISSVVFVVRGEESYGVRRKLLSIMEKMRARGVGVILYAVGDGEFVSGARAIEGVEVHLATSPPPRFMGHGLRKVLSFASVIASSRALIRDLNAFLKTSHADALVFCEHGWVVQIAMAVKGFRGRAFWLMPNVVNGSYPLDVNRRIYASAFKRSGMVPVGNSRYTMSTLGRAGRSAEVILLGVDPEHFNDRSVKPAEIPGVPETAVKVLMVARVLENKGQLLMLRAILSRPELKDLHLILVGGASGPEYPAEMERVAEEAGARDRLHMLGPIADPRPYYAAADIAANVRLGAEPFGLTVVEAMMARKPVLAHRLGGPGEIIVDGETGWLIPNATVDDLADGLVRMLKDRDRWGAMGEAGERRALESFTSTSMTDQLLEIIDRRCGAARA